MDKNKFCFELIDKYTPDTVIRNMLKQIDEATDRYVQGNIEEYDGPIASYKKEVGIVAGLGSLRNGTIHVDIQDELGEQNNKRNRFEVFISVKGLEYYKYRLMFVDYGTISYPVTIVMNEELAAEYSGRRNDRFLIGSMKELEEMMNAIMNSDTMIALLQNLINEALRQESKEEGELVENSRTSEEK